MKKKPTFTIDYTDETGIHNYRFFVDAKKEDYQKDFDLFVNFLKNAPSLHAMFQVDDFLNDIFNFIDTNHIVKYSYNDVFTLGTISEGILQAKDYIKYEKHKMALDFFIHFKYKGEKWYNKFQKCFINISLNKQLSSSIYNICKMIYEDEFLTYHVPFLIECIINLTDFEQEQKELYDFLELNMTDLKFEITRKKRNEMQERIKDFIWNYYALTILYPNWIIIFDNLYLILSTNILLTLLKMKKCDKVTKIRHKHKNLYLY